MPHINEKIDFTSEVFIVYNNKVLLRKHDKYNIWLSVGGHIELGEDPIEAAYREVKEEVGLDIEIIPTTKIPNTNSDNFTNLIPPAFMNRHLIKDNHEHVTLVYFAKAFNDTLKEVSENCQWFCIEELEQNEEINETVKIYAREALKYN